MRGRVESRTIRELVLREGDTRQLDGRTICQKAQRQYKKPGSEVATAIIFARREMINRPRTFEKNFNDLFFALRLLC